MEIPLVDLSHWASGSDADRRAVAASLDAAFADSGFAIVVGHGIDQERVRVLREQALEFFLQEEAAKRPWEVADLTEVGWIPMGMEANGYAFGVETPPDLKETYSIRRGVPDHAIGEPAMVALAREHLEAATEVYELLVDACALALGLDDPAVLSEPCRDASNTLNMNWYPAIERIGAPLPGQYRIGPHSDFGSITVLDREPGIGCLQVELRDGRWVDAPHVPGGLVVNAGDLLEMWSGRRWRSAHHRVLPPDPAHSTEQLVSLVAFCDVRPDTLIAPLPGSVPATAFAPIVAGEWIAEKMAQITVRA
ncbi:MAG: oxidoreductase [Ilumatobacteraceae bacterium]|nr:oxidoreductase [Ilumatobacteraceae bacterium]